jgi:hypothetical protein
MKFIVTAFLVLALAAGVAAQDEQSMPEMGAPAEMEHARYLAGEWRVAMQSRWDPAQADWMESEGQCTYEKVLDGCAMEFVYTGSAMGMPFLARG